MRYQALILVLSLFAAAAQAETPLRYFGYVGIECGLDDLHDPDTKNAYSDEVAGFSNLNMACVDADPAVTGDRIRRVAAGGADVVLNIQPALFSRDANGLKPNPEREALWPLIAKGIKASGVATNRIVFYLVDEPSLHGLVSAQVSEAAQFVRGKIATARLMVVDAKMGIGPARGPGPIPPELNYWGFFEYFHADPGADLAYVTYLDNSAKRLHPGQVLVLVMDAMHAPFHAENGISEADMAGVAQAYYQLAQKRGDIGAILAYSWVGGIDQPWEKGVRDLPPEVRAAHEKIGRKIIGN